MCTNDCGSGCFGAFYRWFWAQVTKNINVINNNSSGVVRMYVTTSVTHKHEVPIDLFTFIQIVNNFALEPYSKLYSIHNFFVNRYVCQISMRFEEANCAWNNWFTEVQLWRFGRNFCRWTGFIWSLLVTKVVTYIRTTLTLFLPMFFSKQVFSSHDDTV